MKKIHGVHIVLLLFKIFFVLFDATTESVNCSVLQKSIKTFLQFDLAKKLRLEYWKFTATFIGDDLSITDIALKNWDFSIIGIAQGFLKLSIIGIAMLQKGLSCPSLAVA